MLPCSQDMNALDAAGRMKSDPADPAILAMPGDDAAKVRAPPALHCPPASLPLLCRCVTMVLKLRVSFVVTRVSAGARRWRTRHLQCSQRGRFASPPRSHFGKTHGHLRKRQQVMHRLLGISFTNETAISPRIAFFSPCGITCAIFFRLTHFALVSSGFTPLMVSVEQGHVACCEFLLQSGSRVNAVATGNGEKR